MKKLLLNQNLISIIRMIILTIAFLGQSKIVFGQNEGNRLILGEDHARKSLENTLKDKVQHNVINSDFIIIKDTNQATKFAEQILFDVYGKKEISNQRPYEIYNIEKYWIISGALPKGWKGGTFLIIIDSRNCRVLRITHGK